MAGAFNCPRITIAHPHFGLSFTHDISDHFYAAVSSDDMQDTRQSTENPFPGISAIDPVTGLITMHHRALADVILDLLYLTRCPLTSSFHDLIDPTLADLHLMQVKQCFLSASIAHMLFLSVVHHRRFQATAKCPVHLQPGGWFFNVRLHHIPDRSQRTAVLQLLGLALEAAR